MRSSPLLAIVIVTSMAACSSDAEPELPVDDPDASDSAVAPGEEYGDDEEDDEGGDDRSEGPEGDGDGDGGGDGDPGQPGEGEMPDNAYCQPAAGWDPNWVAHAEDLIERINAVRAEGRECGAEGELPPVPPLNWNPALTCASRNHSGDMAERDFFDHVNPDGNDAQWRYEQAGFTGQTWAENIGAGFPVAADIIEGWLDSDIHCGNLLDPGFTEIGVGYAFGPEAAYAHYWTLSLGAE